MPIESIDSDNAQFDASTSALAIALSATLPYSRHEMKAAALSPDMCWDLAQSTKCTGLIRLIEPSLVDWDSTFSERLARDQISTLRSNLAQLAETMECQAVLRQNGITSLAFKGVARQLQLYNRPDVRISSDIDLLVNPTDYPKACSVLAATGYRPGVSIDSRWWHHCLGESPYLPTPPHRFVVDLHHQLQQPGGPPPRHLAELFRRSATIDFGGGSVTTLEPLASLLVTMISYSKAARDLSPWVVYAHEILVARNAFSSGELRAFLDLAASQGLLRLAQDAFGKADLLWRSLDRMSSGEPLSPSDATIVMSALGKSRAQLFRRTVLRWSWADGTAPRRAIRALLMALSEYRSIYIRRQEQQATLSAG